MDYKDKEKLERLRKIFDLNYRMTHLYASYLTNFPEVITRDMISELTADGDIEKGEAVSAIMAAIFGLDDSNGRDERKLIREYINPSVRILDTKRYTENKYYKNIKIENEKFGNWELKWESYAPYRAVICDDVILNPDFSEIYPIGFFTEEFRFPAVLEGGNEWMTLTPVDLDTSEYAIERARGRVITFGLGLGYFAYMASEKEDVESVTVVELSSDVIRLFREKILPKFSHPEKINIVNADAFEYAEKTMPNENFDFAFVDTWRDASDGAPMYKKMKALEHLSRGTEFSYWIENFIISRLRAEKFEELYALVKQDSENAPKSYCEFIERLKQYG
jgi:hypothetical protein